MAVLLLMSATAHAGATSGNTGNTGKSETGVAPGNGPLPKVHTPKTGHWPKTLPGHAAAPAVKGWSPDEIKAERERCTAMLAGLDVVSIPAEPIRDGDCGAPAPIELISVGNKPQVTFSTPAIVTCDMAAAFDKWLKTDLQAAAREHLGSPVVRVEIMSAYSCRNAYGRKKSRISEHGRANALDIRGFVTERGATVDLQTDWGPTGKDIKAQIAAAAAKAKADEERAEAIKREAELAAARQQVAPAQSGAPAASMAGAAENTGNPAPLRGRVDDQPTIQGGLRSWRPSPSLGLTPPSQLGGPKSDKKDERDPRAGKSPPLAKPAEQHATAPHAPSPQTAKGRFLRRAHTSACQTFGTVLGPEANEDHRNHFHIDMAERQGGHYCE